MHTFIRYNILHICLSWTPQKSIFQWTLCNPPAEIRFPMTLEIMSSECAICLSLLPKYPSGSASSSSSDTPRTLPCMHLFHQDCIAEWFDTGSTLCPICRTPAKLPPPAKVSQQQTLFRTHAASSNSSSPPLLTQRQSQAPQYLQTQAPMGPWGRSRGPPLSSSSHWPVLSAALPTAAQYNAY
eukprot:g24393.t1